MKKKTITLLCFLFALFMPTRAELVWKAGEALITDASQITGTPPHDSRFTVANLIRPESDGVGTNQYIYHTAWSGDQMITAAEDPFLQFHLPKAEQHIIFSMIGSAWQQTYDTPTEVVIEAANLPDGEWTEVAHLKNMDNDFTSYTPERYTSPHIDLGAEYTDVKFLVKKTYTNRKQSAGGLLLSLGRFQIFEAYEGEPDPIGPVWKKDEALLTDASQITANSWQNGFPPSNLLRPESDGVGTNQYIWHTAWSNPAPLPANTDPYLQVHLNQPETDIIFTMIGTTWGSANDTPTEVVIEAANLPGYWTEVEHLTGMNADFTGYSPDRYQSPHIALGTGYTDIRFVVKQTVNVAKSDRYDSNGNPFVALGRFQVYRAVEGEPDPIDPRDNINLLFIGNSITAGATLSNASTQAPPIVCRSLIEQATEVTTNVYNGGHSGITTWGYLPGRDDFTRIINNAKAFKRQNGGLIYISIMLGTNDSACTTTLGAPVSPETYGNNIRTIINELLESVPDCKILLNYPIWYSPSTYNGAMYLQEGLDRLHSYYPILDTIVEEYDQVYAGNRGVWEYFENNKALFTRESGNAGYFYLHPNATGATRLAEIWAKSLLELIEADGVEVKNPLPEWNVFKPLDTKKYSMKTSRGSMGTVDGKLSSTVKTGIGASKGEFAFISHEGQLYLYSIADKSFMYRNPVSYQDDWSNIICSNEHLQPIKVNYTGTPTAYPYYLTMGEYVLNSASSTQTGICANTYTPHDSGNQTSITEEGDFDPSEALAAMESYFGKQLTVTYRIQDAEGKVLDEFTAIGMEGDFISEVPDNMTRKAFTTYTVQEPVTLAKEQDNVVLVLATWALPFEVSPDMSNPHWYNLALREGNDFVNAAEGYKCNTNATKEDLLTDAYQWAFQGNPYDGIVVYNRSDVTKTLSKVYSEEKQNYVAVLAEGTFKWRIVESDKGFLLATDNSYPYINEFGGAGGHLGFWGSINDVGSIFTVCEVGDMKVENVRLTTGAYLKIFRAPEDKANGKSVILIPGGGYAYVAGSYEGSDWAPFYNDLGFTAAVLTYNLPAGNPEVPLNDGRAALQYLRDNAGDLRIEPYLIGVMGFSAGGHLASTIATHLTGSELPAFQVLFYPVITMDSRYTHAGSRENLLGSNPSDELVNLYSNDLQVKAETPVVYLCWATDDSTVKPINSRKYKTALTNANVSVKSRTFSSGGHGFGFNPSFTYHNQMLRDLTDWLTGLDKIITGIDEVLPQSGNKEGTFNLAGQRVSEHFKGIVIKEGKKIVVQ